MQDGFPFWKFWLNSHSLIHKIHPLKVYNSVVCDTNVFTDMHLSPAKYFLSSNSALKNEWETFEKLYKVYDQVFQTLGFKIQILLKWLIIIISIFERFCKVNWWEKWYEYLGVLFSIVLNFT